jgi:pimeloyl-ACP methyl ester carboxylesterase
MASVSVAWTEETRCIAGVELHLRKGGTGSPLLILNDEFGHMGALRYQEELAQDHTVYIPSHPGFGPTPRLDWIMNVRDLAGWYLLALEEMGLQSVDTIGFSMGGWLAAEMATMDPGQFNRLAQVGAMGVLPPEGYIFDMFLSVPGLCITACFHDPDGSPEFQVICPDQPAPEQAQAWEIAREEACRLGWKPYMYYPGLPNLLSRLKRLPTMVVWGREDGFVPLSAGQLYHRSIPGSRLEILDSCGHMPQVEKSDQFLGLMRQFFS